MIQCEFEDMLSTITASPMTHSLSIIVHSLSGIVHYLPLNII
jgi:hypothetical protein